MSVLRLLAKAFTVEQPFTNLTGPGRYGSLTGVEVSRERAMQTAAVWACVRLRAETVASLPVGVVAYDGPNRVAAPDPPWLVRPNPETTRFELFERTCASIDVDGNAFWFLIRNRLGQIVEVWPLPPSAVSVYREKRTEPKRFRIAGETFGDDEVLHIPGFSLPGRLRGLAPIEQHVHAIGLAVAAEEFGEAFFGNGAVSSGVITSPADPGPDNVERMRATFENHHRGVRRAHRPGFLFGGATWTQLSIPNDAAQFLETRRYQTEEIARIFRVPPHKIGDLARATFSNIEHQAIEWITDGVLPYTTRIEAAVLAAGLIDPDQRLRFNFAGQLRGDTAARYAAYAIGRQWGWLSVNDIRALEDLNPLPGDQGGVYLEPLNMIPAGTQLPPTPPKSSKIGARNAQADLERIQTAHDAIAYLGAICVPADDLVMNGSHP